MVSSQKTRISSDHEHILDVTMRDWLDSINDGLFAHQELYERIPRRVMNVQNLNTSADDVVEDFVWKS
jgi:hypothetical protein